MKNILSVKLIIKATVGAAILASVGLWLILTYANQTPKMKADFELSYRGELWLLNKNSKKLTLFYAGYAKCPDVCPLSLSFSSQAFKKLNKKELGQIQFVFLSVDQENDSPNNVADYAAQFFPSFVGLSGTKEQIDKAVKSVGASYMVEKNPKSYLGYSIAHSDRIFILDKKGIVVDSIPNPRSDELIYNKIRELL